MITTHSLSPDVFVELAGGAGDSVIVRQLQQVQLSKHLMLLRVVAEAASRVDPPTPATAAFRAGYDLLARTQGADSDTVATLLTMPHIGSWAHDCVACLDRGSLPDFGYLAAVAVAAAVRVGIRFEIDVPVRDGCVPLPGLGYLEVADQGDWIRLASDGKWLSVGEHVNVECTALVPDDGSARPVPYWQGTPVVRAVADGQIWEVLLEITDRHLDRYALPMLTALTTSQTAEWRDRIQVAWELLVRHHEWAAGPIAAGVPVIVPLAPRSDFDSATSPAAFGAIATSLPPSTVSMAETLVHEFQHIKLCGLMDVVPLVESRDEKGYAPWRDDPRPAGGILQGVYAFTGIVRFWNAQRHLETEPDGILRANVLYERWRLAIERVADTLLGERVLTPAGIHFVTVLTGREAHQESESVLAEAIEIAQEVALDNWLTWQLRHRAFDATRIADLAAVYQRGESRGGQVLPEARIEDSIRTVDSVLRSRLLNMRYQDQVRYSQLSAADLPELDAADRLLIRGNASAALAAYRERLIAGPDPAAWIGLALAVHRLPTTPSRPVLASHLPLLFEVHARLADQGIHVDPLDLAGWFE